MINSIRQEIVNKLMEVYPGYTIYVDDVPQNFKKQSFLISLIDQDYDKRLNNKYRSLLSFDVAYFSKSATDIKADCQDKQLSLFRAFDLIGTYRAQNKQSTLVDNVLHFTFDINYSEMRVEEGIATMKKQQTNTEMEG